MAKLKKIPLSERDNIMIQSLEMLGESSETKIVKFLKKNLESSDVLIRNYSAKSLAKIGNEKALPSLIKAIKKPENKSSRATLVHAIGSFNYEDYFLLIVDLAFNGNYEVQNNSIELLEKGHFKVTDNHIKIAIRRLNEFKNRKNKCDDWEYITEDVESVINKLAKKLKKK